MKFRLLGKKATGERVRYEAGVSSLSQSEFWHRVIRNETSGAKTLMCFTTNAADAALIADALNKRGE